jgi:tryptophan synthase alpha chain
MARAGGLGRGFLYVISRLGVTGARQQVAGGLAELTARIRANATLPLALGFGLSHRDHEVAVGACADAAVVGSALVERIARHAGMPDLEDRVQRFVAWLAGQGPEPGDA